MSTGPNPLPPSLPPPRRTHTLPPLAFHCLALQTTHPSVHITAALYTHERHGHRCTAHVTQPRVKPAVRLTAQRLWSSVVPATFTYAWLCVCLRVFSSQRLLRVLLQLDTLVVALSCEAWFIQLRAAALASLISALASASGTRLMLLWRAAYRCLCALSRGGDPGGGHAHSSRGALNNVLSNRLSPSLPQAVKDIQEVAAVTIHSSHSPRFDGPGNCAKQHSHSRREDDPNVLLEKHELGENLSLSHTCLCSATTTLTQGGA